MSWLLAVDTTAEFGSIALLRDDAIIEEMPLRAPDGFGHVIFGALEAFLTRHQLRPEDIACFAGATGPGSFTGVRVGLTVVKGLAEAAGRPAVGVSNLKAMASSVGRTPWSAADPLVGPLRATILDARRGEVYGAVYDTQLECIQQEVVMRLPDWLAALPSAHIEFVAQDFTPFAQLLEGQRTLQAPRALAAAIGLLAWREFEQGLAIDPAALDANYVRRSDAELLWKEM